MGQVPISDSILQEQTKAAAHTYIKNNEKRLNNLLSKANKRQQKILNKIQKQQLSKIKTDPSSFIAVPIYDDSLGFHFADTTIKLPEVSKSYPRLDSLRRINEYLGTGAWTNRVIKPISPDKQTATLLSLEQKIRQQKQFDSWLDQYVKQIKHERTPSSKKLTKYLEIQQSRLNYIKEHLAQPDKIEERALEYLRGTPQFEQQMSQSMPGLNNIDPETDLASLQRMGYQTKALVNNQLTQQFGNKLNAVKERIGTALQGYKTQIDKAMNKKQALQNEVAAVKGMNLGIEDEQSYRNPMRGIPFWYRWKPGFDFETYRATEKRGAVLKTGITLSYQQSPRMDLGFGGYFNLGLGRDFRHIKFSGEGIGLNGLITYRIIYGFGLEGGYERSWGQVIEDVMVGTDKDGVGVKRAGRRLKDLIRNPNNNFYIGIKKQYTINQKWLGELLIGYNALWERNGFNSPIFIKIGWRKK